MTARDMLSHVLARLGVRRSGWRVSPGLYRLGEPGPESPVFASANYTLSFDALRGSLDGIDCYILVLETFGINVWCAAGKGSFGTDELVSRIEQTRLADEVSTRTVIVPQLGATGVCAREVLRRTGFKVRFGPIRAEDIPAFLERGEATEEMRSVTFDLKDRAVLIPVEGKIASPIMAGLTLGAYLADGPVAAAGVGAAGVAGFAGFPILMPWIPTKDFSTKGFVLGGAVGLASAGAALLSRDGSTAQKAARAASYMLTLPAITSFIALNFTGATPFASPTGVRREIFKYVPVMAVMAASGVLVNGARHLFRRKGGC